MRTLATARVLVPVAARATALDTAPASGIRVEKESEMALVTVAGRDGRRALPVFTSSAAFTAWRPSLRPVPVEGARAARTALDDGAAALLVDPAETPRLVVSGEALHRLAEVWDTAAGGPA